MLPFNALVASHLYCDGDEPTRSMTAAAAVVTTWLAAPRKNAGRAKQNIYIFLILF